MTFLGKMSNPSESFAEIMSGREKYYIGGLGHCWIVLHLSNFYKK